MEMGGKKRNRERVTMVMSKKKYTFWFSSPVPTMQLLKDKKTLVIS
jgi:hypothetical protein